MFWKILRMKRSKNKNSVTLACVHFGTPHKNVYRTIYIYIYQVGCNIGEIQRESLDIGNDVAGIHDPIRKDGSDSLGKVMEKICHFLKNLELFSPK